MKKVFIIFFLFPVIVFSQTLEQELKNFTIELNTLENLLVFSEKKEKIFILYKDFSEKTLPIIKDPQFLNKLGLSNKIQYVDISKNVMYSYDNFLQYDIALIFMNWTHNRPSLVLPNKEKLTIILEKIKNPIFVWLTPEREETFEGKTILQVLASDPVYSISGSVEQRVQDSRLAKNAKEYLLFYGYDYKFLHVAWNEKKN